ncbi:hypothetical protein R5W23_001808, partial [Gemmata sp. JC673]
LIVGRGSAADAQVLAFSGATGTQLGTPLGEYTPFDTGGVFLGASNDPAGKRAIEAFVFADTNRNGVFDSGEAGVAGVQITLSGTASGSVVTDATGGYRFGGEYGIGTYTLSFALPTGGGSGNATQVTVIFEERDGPSAFVQVGLYSGNVLIPILPETLSCITGGELNNVIDTPAPAKGNDSGKTTARPIRYADGVLVLAATDLASDALGAPWGQARSWSNNPAYAGNSTLGNGWVSGEQLRLYQSGSSVILVTNALTARFFDGQGVPDGSGNYASYAPRFTDTNVVTYDATHDEFVVSDGAGGTVRFFGFGTGYLAAQRGTFKGRTDAGGHVTEVVSLDVQGRPTEVQQSATVGGATVTESYWYTYLGGGDPNADRLSSVTLRQRTGAGAWVTVRAVEYQYYAGGTANGNLGDLERAVLKDASGTVLDQWYYRYYTSDVFTAGIQTGYQGGMKYALGSAAYDRLRTAVGGTDGAVDSASDATVASYADNAFEYDFLHRATKEVAAGEGCSACSAGQGTYTYAYTTSVNPDGVNSWKTKTVERLPTGSTNTVYTNYLGQVMLRASYDPGAAQTWVTYYRYDAAGRVVFQAEPSAMTGYSDSYADLVHFVSGNASYVSDSSGLVTGYTYGASTTATTSTAGDALGYLKQAAIRQGETGTAVPQYAATYIMSTVSGLNFFYVASETVYRNDNGTGGQTTSYSYTFTSGTNQIASTTVTLPAVTTAQNGSNSGTTATVVNDAFGRPVWAKDQAGVLSYTQYDDLTGAVVKTITDVNTSLTGTFVNLPSGWSTPSGAGLHLTTSYEVDALGRATKVTHPNGRVDYAVYNDAAHEVRTYTGWDASTNRPTGPTTVTREDRANGYTETLTMSAAPAVSGGRPTGAESIAQVQSLSRSTVNAVGQVISEDAYFDLGGLSYSASAALGTEGVNFYRTRYQYDDTGAVKRVQTAQGTITRTVRDARGRVVSEWVGTDDTPTSGYWSPSNTAGTNLVKVREYQYDGGGRRGWEPHKGDRVPGRGCGGAGDADVVRLAGPGGGG